MSQSQTMGNGSTPEKSPRRISGRVWFQSMTGAASAGAAKKRAARLEAAWRQYLFSKRLAGDHAGLARCLKLTQMEVEAGPVLPIRKALELAGQSERKESACRDAAEYGEMTKAELHALLRALDLDDATNLQTRRAITAELELRP